MLLAAIDESNESENILLYPKIKHYRPECHTCEFYYLEINIREVILWIKITAETNPNRVLFEVNLEILNKKLGNNSCTLLVIKDIIRVLPH